MRRIERLVVLLMLVSPAWAEKEITVQQLAEMLSSMHQAGKTDEQMAAELKDHELSQELTHKAMDDMAADVPGPLTTTQLYILEVGGAVLAPPSADIPSLPAPDAAAQKEMLDKADSYAADTFTKLPAVTATKTVARFSDDTTAAMSQAGTKMGNAGNDPYVHTPTESLLHSVRYIGQTEASVITEKGVEKAPGKKDKTRWGENGQIGVLGPGPVLNRVMQEAKVAGRITWVRWETVNGWQTGVFSFVVDKKASHYAVDYCCFPDVGQERSRRRRGRCSIG